MLAHSMGNGTVTGAFSGDIVQSGLTLRTAGATLTNYPTGNSPGQGPLGYLGDEMIAQAGGPGVITDGYIIRRATNGVLLTNPQTDTNLAGIRDDVVALAKGDPQVLAIWLGANDRTEAQYLAYVAPTGLRRTVLLARDEFPGAVIQLWGERTTDDASYPFLALINAHKQEIAAEFPFVQYVDPTGIGMADEIHPDDSGYATMAARAAAMWLGL